MATLSQEKKIKSADRVLEILELFTPGRQSVTVMEVARSLDMPQSSTSELLGSLVRRGYLYRDRAMRAFRPSARIALLGAWVHPALFRHGHLPSMMDELAESTGEIVALCSMPGVKLKHIHVVGETAIPDEFASGAERHLLHSPFGLTLISMTGNDELRRIVHRLNAESAEDEHVRFADLATEIDVLRRRGYAIGRVADGWSGIAVLLPQEVGEERLSIGVICRDSVVEERADELLRQMRGAVSRYLGPRIAFRDAPQHASMI